MRYYARGCAVEFTGQNSAHHSVERTNAAKPETESSRDSGKKCLSVLFRFPGLFPMLCRAVSGVSAVRSCANGVFSLRHASVRSLATTATFRTQYGATLASVWFAVPPVF